MNIHIYHHAAPDPNFIREQAFIRMQLENIMSTLDLLLDDVRAQKTQIDSLSALIANIKNQLRDALSGEKLSPAAEAKLAAIMPQLEANTAAINDAINANTDAAPADLPGTTVIPPGSASTTESPTTSDPALGLAADTGNSRTVPRPS